MLHLLALLLGGRTGKYTRLRGRGLAPATRAKRRGLR
jgi:hypothetical protein